MLIFTVVSDTMSDLMVLEQLLIISIFINPPNGAHSGARYGAFAITNNQVPAILSVAWKSVCFVYLWLMNYCTWHNVKWFDNPLLQVHTSTEQMLFSYQHCRVVPAMVGSFSMDKNKAYMSTMSKLSLVPIDIAVKWMHSQSVKTNAHNYETADFTRSKWKKQNRTFVYECALHLIKLWLNSLKCLTYNRIVNKLSYRSNQCCLQHYDLKCKHIGTVLLLYRHQIVKKVVCWTSLPVPLWFRC